jgi:hypothetical protein
MHNVRSFKHHVDILHRSALAAANRIPGTVGPYLLEMASLEDVSHVRTAHSIGWADQYGAASVNPARPVDTLSGLALLLRGTDEY